MPSGCTATVHRHASKWRPTNDKNDDDDDDDDLFRAAES